MQMNVYAVSTNFYLDNLEQFKNSNFKKELLKYI